MLKYSNLKELAHEHGIKTSLGAYSHLEKLIKDQVLVAIKKAKAEGKSTLRPEHFKK